MDGAYDTNDAFNLMAEKGVDCPGIKIRENAVIGDDPSPRSNAVLEFKKLVSLETNAPNMDDDGQLKVYSLQSSGFLGRP